MYLRSNTCYLVHKEEEDHPTCVSASVSLTTGRGREPFGKLKFPRCETVENCVVRMVLTVVCR